MTTCTRCSHLHPAPPTQLRLAWDGVHQLVGLLHLSPTEAGHIGVVLGECVDQHFILRRQEDLALLIDHFEFGLDGVVEEDAASSSIEVGVGLPLLH